VNSDSFSTEEERLRSAYISRRDDDWRYSWLNPSQVHQLQEQHRAVLGLMRAAGYASLAQVSALEIGCGTGHWLRQLIDWGAEPARLTGIDLLDGRIETAKRLCPAKVTLRVGNAAAIESADASFDIVMQFTVFTSILDAELRQAVASEMVRVAKPDGLIIWYDFHTPSPNKNVKAIKKQEIVRLFPNCDIKIRRITLAPPIVRFLQPRVAWLVGLLNLVPLLRTHYLAVITPRKR
jgi:SAM-dependent methyltransferase